CERSTQGLPPLESLRPPPNKEPDRKFLMPVHRSIRRADMPVTCAIRYVIDPFKRDAFETYARNWLTIIPACGGGLFGYFIPHEGTNNNAPPLISFGGLAPYEGHRAPLRGGPAAVGDVRLAARGRFILSEERPWLRPVTPA